MLTTLTRYSTVILALVALWYGPPAVFDRMLGEEAGNPLIFFSPLRERFLWRESLGGHQFNYQDEEGAVYDQKGFEAQLPFQYYKNLEKQNALPVTVQDRDFDLAAIEGGRQGFEVKSRHLLGNRPQISLYPLFNNDPALAFMPFPEDVFRISGQKMEFINADHNRLDQELTELFTNALKEQGFVFPATVIGGRATNLKPFDEGYFIRDHVGQVFHVKRLRNRPQVIKTPIDPRLDIRDIIVSEHQRREFYGLAIIAGEAPRLISYDNYQLIALPTSRYQAGAADLMVLTEPLHKTLRVSEERTVHATAMTADYRPLRGYDLPRRDNTAPVVRQLRDLLFPLRLTLDSPFHGQAAPHLVTGGLWSAGGIGLALLGLVFLASRRQRRMPPAGALLAVLFGGLPGLALSSLLGFDKYPARKTGP